MNLDQQRNEIMQELGQLAQQAEEGPTSEELFQKELSEYDKAEEEGQFNMFEGEQQSVEEEVVEEEQEEEVEVEEEEEPEEQLTGAKFRHKLKAEKEARERMEREASELRERLARLEGRAEAQQPAPQQAPAEEIPDAEYEPEKFAIYKAQKLEEQLESMRLEQTRLQAERQWDAMDNEMARSDSNYAEAKKFLIEAEFNDIKHQYPSATDAQIRQHLKQQEYALVGNAVQAGMDPMQQIQFLAWQKGFRQGEASPSEKKAPAKQKSNIKNIKKNAKKNASLIGGSAAAPSGEGATARQLLEMSIHDINKFGADKYATAIKKLSMPRD